MMNTWYALVMCMYQLLLFFLLITFMIFCLQSVLQRTKSLTMEAISYKEETNATAVG